MLCPECRRFNPNTVTVCQHCGSAMDAPRRVPPEEPAWDEPSAPARTSGLAIASLCLSVLGFCTMGVTAIIGIVLGIVALVQIGRDRRHLRGEGLAVAGIAISVLAAFVPILAAMLFPVFARSRENARKATCQSNLKQLGMGMLMYAQDYNEHWPLRATWSDAILPYSKSRMVFTCPSYPPNTQAGYAYNSGLSGVDTKSMAGPARLVVLYDAKATAPGAAAPSSAAGGAWEASVGRNTAGGSSLLDPRHMGGANIGYADGHVKWVMPSSGSLQWRPH